MQWYTPRKVITGEVHLYIKRSITYKEDSAYGSNLKWTTSRLSTALSICLIVMLDETPSARVDARLQGGVDSQAQGREFKPTSKFFQRTSWYLP